MVRLKLFTLAAALLPILTPVLHAATPSRPNFIIFFTDDQGYNDVGCYGSPLIKTPNFDRMALEGVRFTDFYAQPVCGPSRAALMTGCYPIRVAEPGNSKNQHNILHADEVTLAEVLKGAGYTTGMVGKWHLAGPRRDAYPTELMPNAQGFEHFYGTPVHNGYTREVSPKSFRTQIMRDNDILVDALDQQGMNNLTRDYTHEAIKFIRANKEKPFFLYLAHNMPHVPLGASDAFRGKSPRGLYGDVIQELDWSLGEVMKTLKEEAIDDKTFVLYTSDNGPWIEKHLGDYGGSADPLRGWKMSAWEGGPRVPCIMRWPDRISPGRTSGELITTLDILPTFAGLAGAKLPGDRVLDGMDMWGVISGAPGVQNPRETFLFYNWIRLNAVRRGKWKLVLPRPANPPGTGWSGRMIDAVPNVQLYDLTQDISEKRDVAAQHPDVVARLTKLAESARHDLGDHNRVGEGCRFFDGPAPAKWGERRRARKPPPVKSHPAPVGDFRFTFEDGSAQGWRAIDGDLKALVATLKPLYQHGDDGREGKALLCTLSRTRQWDGGDQHTAVLESPPFRLRGSRMSFLLGGGKHAETYVALVDAETGKEIKVTVGPGEPRMKRMNWNDENLKGRVLRLRVVDRFDRGPWGHVTFDDFSAEAEAVPDRKRPQATQRDVSFRFADVPGIGKESGLCRRDPSDAIKVGDTYYVWYSKTTRKRKLYPSGYNATVWYATSKDEGRTWSEQGESIVLSDEGFDSFGIFTPNILVADGTYYLFYTAVAKGFSNKGYSDIERTAIGLAVSDSPAGPWRKVKGNPVLESSRDPKRFDSFRVDDTCFIVQDGKYWMYYKGRQWENTPGHTKMGVAVADSPAGPYRRLNDGRFVQDSGHEVLVWPQGDGVMSLVSGTGPRGRTLQYAADGLAFRVEAKLPGRYPHAPGAFRPDLTDAAALGKGITWGIGMVHGRDPYLVRYEIEYP
jgi:arylsulfatase